MGCTQSKSTDAAEEGVGNSAAPKDRSSRTGRIWKRLKRRHGAAGTGAVGDNNKPLEPGAKPDAEERAGENADHPRGIYIPVSGGSEPEPALCENGSQNGRVHAPFDPDLDQPPTTPPPPPPSSPLPDDSPAGTTKVTIEFTVRTTTTVTETKEETEYEEKTESEEKKEIEENKEIEEKKEVEEKKETDEEAVPKAELEELDITEVMEEMKRPGYSGRQKTGELDANGEAISEAYKVHLEDAVKLLDDAEQFLPKVKIESLVDGSVDVVEDEMTWTDRKTATCMPLSAAELEARLSATNADTVESPPPPAASDPAAAAEALLAAENAPQNESAPAPAPAPEPEAEPVAVEVTAPPEAESAPPVEETAATESVAPAATESAPQDAPSEPVAGDAGQPEESA